VGISTNPLNDTRTENREAIQNMILDFYVISLPRFNGVVYFNCSSIIALPHVDFRFCLLRTCILSVITFLNSEIPRQTSYLSPRIPTRTMSSSKPAKHTEEQKRQLYDSLPEEQKKKQTYTEWLYDVYAKQYENWMPWIEDQYLRWFGKDNKASYATKRQYPSLLSLPPSPFTAFPPVAGFES
jgi:hypothetical protein